MRKLKLQMQMSMNGFVGGPNGELDWMTWDWDEDLKKYATQLNKPIDCILLGRKMARDFIDHWTEKANGPDADWFSHKMVDTRKVVFSRTLKSFEGQNTEVAEGGLVEAVNRLKQEEGSDIIVYGGAEFVSELIRHELIDELFIFINPTTIEDGLTIFRNRAKFNLLETQMFECGIAVMKYAPSK
jgi:dihydrofolate reductase